MISSDFGWLMLKKWHTENTFLSIIFSGRSVTFTCFGRIKELSLEEPETAMVIALPERGELLVRLTGARFTGYEDRRALPEQFRDAKLDSFLGLQLLHEEHLAFAAYDLSTQI